MTRSSKGDALHRTCTPTPPTPSETGPLLSNLTAKDLPGHRSSSRFFAEIDHTTNFLDDRLRRRPRCSRRCRSERRTPSASVPRSSPLLAGHDKHTDRHPAPHVGIDVPALDVADSLHLRSSASGRINASRSRTARQRDARRSRLRSRPRRIGMRPEQCRGCPGGTIQISARCSFVRAGRPRIHLIRTHSARSSTLGHGSGVWPPPDPPSGRLF